VDGVGQQGAGSDPETVIFLPSREGRQDCGTGLRLNACLLLLLAFGGWDLLKLRRPRMRVLALGS
jgi:hypothetical protein